MSGVKFHVSRCHTEITDNTESSIAAGLTSLTLVATRLGRKGTGTFCPSLILQSACFFLSLSVKLRTCLVVYPVWLTICRTEAPSSRSQTRRLSCCSRPNFRNSSSVAAPHCWMISSRTSSSFRRRVLSTSMQLALIITMQQHRQSHHYFSLQKWTAEIGVCFNAVVCPRNTLFCCTLDHDDIFRLQKCHFRRFELWTYWLYDSCI